MAASRTDHWSPTHTFAENCLIGPLLSWLRLTLASQACKNTHHQIEVRGKCEPGSSSIGKICFRNIGKEANMRTAMQTGSALSRFARALGCALISLTMTLGLAPEQSFAQNAEGGVLS